MSWWHFSKPPELIAKPLISSKVVLNCKKNKKEHKAPLAVTHPPIRMVALSGLPNAVDMRPVAPPIFDQGQIGSCTGNAIAGALGLLEIKELQSRIGPEQFNDGVYDPISRLFIYWNERALSNDTHEDAGSTLSDGINSIKDKGICRESSWPYHDNLLFRCPVSSAYSEAWHHKILQEYSVDNSGPDQIRASLATGYPVVFGITLYDSFMSNEVALSGVVPYPDTSNENAVGGHALCIVGYDDAKRWFIVRNSWGAGWGDQGYCYMPYAMLEDTNMAWDFWALVR